MIDLPFSENEQLNTELILSLNPTTKPLHLQRTDPSLTTLPNAPRVHLDPVSTLTHLTNTLLTPGSTPYPLTSGSSPLLPTAASPLYTTTSYAAGSP